MSAILILLFASASLPEARTVCGKTARTDPCGGRWAIGVPTAIIRPVEQKRLDKGDKKAGGHHNKALNRLDKKMLDMFLRRGSN